MATKKQQEEAPVVTTETREDDIIVTRPASVWETLSHVNCNGHTEQKNGLTYLSWAWAWSEVKKSYPGAFYTIYERPDGCPYWTDGRTCWVKTGVTIEGLEHIEYLPVMNNRNQSIPLASVTSMDMNKAIQRSLTKACARHGLGIYIYAGEDLPEAEQQAKEATQAEQEQRAITAIGEINEAADGDQYAAVKDKYMDLLIGDTKNPAVIRAAQLKYQQLFNN